jgi:hypothetical protein
MRRIAIMRTVTALPPPYEIWHLPYGMRAQLAQQFAVSTWTIYHDLKRLNAGDLPRFYMGLAQERERKERIMGARVTIRLSKALREHLADLAAQRGVELFEVIRQALQIYLNGTPREAEANDGRDGHTPHQLEDCAHAILTQCVPERAARLAAIALQLGRSLPDVVGELVTQGLRMKWWWENTPQAPGARGR